MTPLEVLVLLLETKEIQAMTCIGDTGRIETITHPPKGFYKAIKNVNQESK